MKVLVSPEGGQKGAEGEKAMGGDKSCTSTAESASELEDINPDLSARMERLVFGRPVRENLADISES